MIVTRYEKATGRVFTTVNVPDDDVSAQESDIYGVVPGRVPPEQYIKNGTPTARPRPAISVSKTRIASDGSDSSLLSGIPAGSEVRINDTVVTVPAEGLTLRARRAGVFRIEFDTFPNMPWSGLVEAV